MSESLLQECWIKTGKRPKLLIKPMAKIVSLAYGVHNTGKHQCKHAWNKGKLKHKKILSPCPCAHPNIHSRPQSPRFTAPAGWESKEKPDMRRREELWGRESLISSLFLCASIRETSINNYLVGTSSLCACVQFYVFLFMQACEHSFFMLVFVCAYISQVWIRFYMSLYWDNFRPVAKTIADEHSSSTFCAVSNVRRNAFILICCIFDHISDVSCVEKKTGCNATILLCVGTKSYPI